MGAKYSTVTVSGYNASPPSDDGTQSDANKVKWATIKSKLADPPKTAIEAIDTALVSAFDYAINQKTAAYTTVAADHMRIIEVAPNVSSAVTISLGDASTMTNNYRVGIKNSGSATVTVGRATSGDTIDGAAANKTLGPGQLAWFATNSGADGYLVVGTANYSSGNHTIAGTLTVTGAVNGLNASGGSSSASVADSSPTTLFAFAAQGLYLVYAWINLGNAAAYTASARVHVEGTSLDARITADNGGSLTLTVSGQNVRATQTSGVTQTVNYAYQKLA